MSNKDFISDWTKVIRDLPMGRSPEQTGDAKMPQGTQGRHHSRAGSSPTSA